MSSCVFIDTGQCGNQLGYTLLDSLYDHIVPPILKKEFEKVPNDLDFFFRKSRNGSKLYSRSVCLDTEPKVINECLTRSRQRSHKWELDPKSIAYLHGGRIFHK